VSIKDFFGLDKSTDNQNEQSSPVPEAAAERASGGVDRLDDETSGWAQTAYEDSAPDDAAPDGTAFSFDDVSGSTGEPGESRGYDLSAPAEPKEELSVSMIAAEASVTGDIITAGHIDILGKVSGDVEAKGNVAVQGVVKGNVAGEKIGLYECTVKGDLEAEIGIVADSGSTVIGDIHAKNIIFDGRLKGDIKADNVVVLRSNAYHVGDVITDSLAIETGAVINGHIKMLVDGDLNAPFDE
jgi:cytoskeletal protein CcmA (bactofilin family)